MTNIFRQELLSPPTYSWKKMISKQKLLTSNLLLSTSATSSTKAATHTAIFAIFTQLLFSSDSLFSFGSSAKMIWCVSPAVIFKYSSNRKVMSHRTGNMKLERTSSRFWVKRKFHNCGTSNQNSGPNQPLGPQRAKHFHRQKVRVVILTMYWLLWFTNWFFEHKLPRSSWKLVTVNTSLRKNKLKMCVQCVIIFLEMAW